MRSLLILRFLFKIAKQSKTLMNKLDVDKSDYILLKKDQAKIDKVNGREFQR